MQAKSKYFIAIIPPSPLYEQAQRWKEFFRDQFNSKAALNSPPHITLHMPFEWKSDKEKFLIDSLKTFSKSESGFRLEANGFDCFAPRVIFIKLVQNPSLLRLQSKLSAYCRQSLDLFNSNRQDKPFHPHLTVAFRDLKKSLFKKAWESVKELPINYELSVEQITLLKHNGRAWEVLSNCEFNCLSTD